VKFSTLNFLVTTRDGRYFILAESVIVYARGARYKIPQGAKSDGASTPREVWPLIPPFGKYWPAAFLHDAAYQNTLLIWRGGQWVTANLSKAECDALLLEAMDALGVGLIERETIYKAVVLAGQSAFDSDRHTLTLWQRIVYVLKRIIRGSAARCRIGPTQRPQLGGIEA
jgi:hypothetical protein